jgi:hypothetical protein
MQEPQPRTAAPERERQGRRDRVRHRQGQLGSDIGNAIRDILGTDCPYLAQREPLFNLVNVPPGNFNNMFKMHRNVLILNVNPQNQTTGMMYKRDQWARPQSVAQINAHD